MEHLEGSEPETQHHLGSEQIDRRGFLKCMAWAGTGLVWTVGSGGLITSQLLGSPAQARTAGFSFVQMSDSHIGFSREGINPDVTHTLEAAVAQINALSQPPALVLHTGDLTHLAKPEQFDTVQKVMNTIRTQKIMYVPGEHDVIGDNGAEYRKRFHNHSGDRLYYSTDYRGVHFIALSNIGAEDVFGVLGPAQLEWLKNDLKTVHRDTPLVVFAHVPLYAVYPAWGWYTKDSAQALALLKRFSSVTVLNGHIHQVMRQQDGQISFHVAGSTAFPQHHPGVDKPGPFPLPQGSLLHSLGYATASVVTQHGRIAVVERTLA